jgi:hypothetical protein
VLGFGLHDSGAECNTAEARFEKPAAEMLAGFSVATLLSWIRETSKRIHEDSPVYFKKGLRTLSAGMNITAGLGEFAT